MATTYTYDASLTRRRTTPLSILPLDIWFLIEDYLTPYDLLHLSHSCKALRALAGRHLPQDVRDFARRSFAQPLGRWSFILALAQTSLDHWACPTCFQIHNVNFEDIPTNSMSCFLEGCPHVNDLDDINNRFVTGLISELGVYTLRFKHIQLAVKYESRSRLGIVHRQHSNDLMTPFSVCLREPSSLLSWVRKHASHASYQHDGRPFLEYRAVPKIIKHNVNGSSPVLRYVLHEELQYKMPNNFHLIDHLPDWTVERFQLSEMVRFAGCQHHTIENRSVLEFQLKHLLKNPPGQSLRSSCRECPTDYEIWFEEIALGRGRHEVLVVHTWKDMRMSEEDWKRRVSNTVHFNYSDAPWVHNYPPGEARYLYENECLPQRRCVDVDEMTPFVRAQSRRKKMRNAIEGFFRGRRWVWWEGDLWSRYRFLATAHFIMQIIWARVLANRRVFGRRHGERV